ncbi:MAG: hypothetical protein U0Z53_24605 [Blastocatellia bacterium]
MPARKRKTNPASLKEMEKLSRRIGAKYDFTKITDENINEAVDAIRRETYAERQSPRRRKIA